MNNGMNRRRLLKALCALPAVKSIEQLSITPDDTLVFTFGGDIDLGDAELHNTIVIATERIRKELGLKHRSIILTKDTDLKVLRRSET